MTVYWTSIRNMRRIQTFDILRKSPYSYYSWKNVFYAFSSSGLLVHRRVQSAPATSMKSKAERATGGKRSYSLLLPPVAIKSVLTVCCKRSPFSMETVTFSSLLEECFPFAFLQSIDPPCPHYNIFTSFFKDFNLFSRSVPIPSRLSALSPVPEALQNDTEKCIIWRTNI